MLVAAGAPRSVIATSWGCPVAVSTVQMPKSRSKAIVLPSFEIDGHNTRPSLNVVTAFALACASAPCTPRLETDQMFCAPLRSDMKYSPLPPAAHIGHASFAPPLVTWTYPASRTIQISLSSRWLCPLRHHCEPAFARAVIATASPAGDGDAKYSVV